MSIAKIFNAMAEEYDDIQDLWYAWLFSRLHFFIARDVISNFHPKTVLDIGSGTGFQSFLHAAAGASVVGVDIAENLIKIANKKSFAFKIEQITNLFPSYFEFVDKYNKSISRILNKSVIDCTYMPPIFLVADARGLPFKSASFDHVNCCGSTLSFIEEHHLALEEIARVLKPRGTFFLEVEARWNMDLLWAVIGATLKGRLGYNTPLVQVVKALLSSPTEHVSIDYPYGRPDQPVYMKIKLFTSRRLGRELAGLELRVLRKYTIHSVTNLIPSTYLDMNNPPHWLSYLFTILAGIEEKINIPLPGCSVVFFGQKNLK